MRVTQLTFLLVIVAALFTVFGAVLDLWFYTIGGLGVALYVGWQFFAFRSLERGLEIDVDRRAQKRFREQRREVMVDVTISSNLGIDGFFTDAIPDNVALVDGENALEIALSGTEMAALHYTVVARGRADIRIETSTFTIRNYFFSDTLYISSTPLEAKQSASVLTVEGGEETHEGVMKGALSANITALHRASSPDESELAYIRPYAVEDPLKRIHWKASAKLNRLMTKEFATELDAIARQVAGVLDEITKESGTVLNIVIDYSATMRTGAPGQTQLDFAANVASYLLGRAIRTGVYTGLVTYDDNEILTDVPPGFSPTHSSTIVRALNTLSARAQRPERRYAKTGIVSTEVARFQKDVDGVADGLEDADAAYFRGLIAYLYQNEEGYHDAIAKAPAFRALATCTFRSSIASVLVVITDLLGDMDPLIEGLLLTASRGISTYVISTFSPTFKPYGNRLVATEELYADYELYRRRVDRVGTIPHVTLIPADSPAYLAPYVRKAKLGAVKTQTRGQL